MRQSAGYRANDGNAVSGKIPDRACRYGARHRDQRARHLRRYPCDSENSGYDHHRKRHGWQMYLGQAAINLDQLSYRFVRLDLEP